MKWTRKEENKIIKEWNKGKKIREIALVFPERSISSVTNRITILRKRGLIESRNKKKQSPTLFGGTKTRDMTSLRKEVLSNIDKYNKYAYGFPRNPDALKYKPKESDKMEGTQSKIIKTLEEIRLFLIKKNEQYGDSALEPIRIFSKADKSEQLKVRIDDKLNRLVQGNADIESDEDVIKDLIGYLVLLLIQMKED